MGRTIAPLLSFDASGQIGSSLVYSKWRGIPYARRYVIPANPRTLAQQETRNIFSTLSQMWLMAPALLTAPWNAFATGRPFTGRNRFMGDNIALLRSQSDIKLMRFSPSARGGLPPSAISVSPAAASLVVDVSLPAIPDGWTLEASVAIAIPDQYPSLPFTAEIVAVEEDVDPSEVTLTGLANGVEYVVGVYLRWTKPDGLIAYSISLNDTGIPTA